jgi:hypothetical protein
MTNPITPPPELVRQWIPAGWDCSPNTFTTLLMRIADSAALWSHDHCKSKIKAATDQELEACCEWLDTEKILTKDGGYIRKLRAARRPKPPSLKEQALAVLDDCANCLDGAHENTIRRALEALDD